MPIAARSRDLRDHRPPAEPGSVFARAADWWQRAATVPTTSESFAPDAVFVGQVRRASVLGKISTPRPEQVRLAIPTEQPSAVWVAEGALKPVTAPGFTPGTLRGKKVASLSVMTAEAARTPGAATAFRAAAESAAVSALDSAILDDAAGTDARPAGLLNGVTPGAAASPEEALGMVLAELLKVAGPDEIVLIGRPDMLAAAVGSSLFAQGRPDMPQLVPTAALPAGRLVGVAVPLILATVARIEFQLTSQATLEIGGVMQNCWQKNLVGVLVEVWADWTRAPGGVAVADVT